MDYERRIRDLVLASDLESLEEELELNEDLVTIEIKGNTLLHFACYENVDGSIAKWLIANGADLELINYDDDKPIGNKKITKSHLYQSFKLTFFILFSNCQMSHAQRVAIAMLCWSCCSMVSESWKKMITKASVVIKIKGVIPLGIMNAIVVMMMMMMMMMLDGWISTPLPQHLTTHACLQTLAPRGGVVHIAKSILPD